MKTFPKELRDRNLYDPILDNMQKCMPYWVDTLNGFLPATNPFHALTEKDDPLIATQEKLIEKIKEILKESYQTVEYREDKPKEWNLRWKGYIETIEDNSTSISHFSLIMSLGVLAPIYPIALNTLLELLKIDYLTARVAAVFGIIYAGYKPPSINKLDLLFTIESRLIYFVPYSILKRVLPGLYKFVKDNNEIAQSLEIAFLQGDPSYFGRNIFYPIEFAFLLVESGRANYKIFDELLYCIRKSDDLNSPFLDYKEQCLQYAPQLLETNSSISEYAEEKTVDFKNHLGDDKLIAWYEVLIRTDLAKTTSKLSSTFIEMKNYLHWRYPDRF